MKRLIDESEIRREVAALGQRLSSEYEGRPLTVLGVLTGSAVLVADVIRQIATPLRLGFLRASSYRGETTRSGTLEIRLTELPEIEGRDILLVDDILDTGRTLSTLVEALRQRGPRSVRTAVLLWKQGRAEVAFQPDFCCFRIPNVFVVGYGLDYNDDYRHLPYIAALEEADLPNA